MVAFDARSQLGWACVAGSWKIKHELNYAWPVEPASIEPLLGKRLTQCFRANDVRPDFIEVSGRSHVEIARDGSFR